MQHWLLLDFFLPPQHVSSIHSLLVCPVTAFTSLFYTSCRWCLHIFAHNMSICGHDEWQLCQGVLTQKREDFNSEVSSSSEQATTQRIVSGFMSVWLYPALYACKGFIRHCVCFCSLSHVVCRPIFAVLFRHIVNIAVRLRCGLCNLRVWFVFSVEWLKVSSCLLPNLARRDLRPSAFSEFEWASSVYIPTT